MSLIATFLRAAAAANRPETISVEMIPALTTEDELALGGLSRVMKEYTGLPLHAALKLGEVVPGKNSSVEILVLKPCLKGLPRARTKFYGDTVMDAAHKAKLFVESILPCEEEP